MISPATLHDAFRKHDLLDALDLRLIAWLQGRAGFSDADDAAKVKDDEDAVAFALVAAALCRAAAEGNLCLPLDEDALGRSLCNLLVAAEFPGDAGRPAASRFLATLEAGRLSAVTGTPGTPRPLVRAHGNLYLHRAWFAARSVADGIRTRRAPSAPYPEEAIAAALRDTLEASPLLQTDGAALELTSAQRRALEGALRHDVFIVAGGPGTGKTTWTAAWLRAALRLPGASPDRVRLCAPTGRAARRLEESLRATLAGCTNNPVDAAAATMPVSTLHTLLGWRTFEGRFARTPDDPLDVDWVLLDEASMADVYLMAALMRALPPGARLVLAGDPGQLPAVEAGAVLGEMLPESDHESAHAPDAIPSVPSVTLDVSHRATGAVIPLATAIRTGHADEALALLGNAVDSANALAANRALARIQPTNEADQGLMALLQAYAVAAFTRGSNSGEPDYASLLERFRILTREEEPGALDALWKLAGRTRVLAPLRRGTVSVERANHILRERLEPAWRRRTDERRRVDVTNAPGFHGAPILVTRNDARTGLSNGDLGLWLETAEGATAFFPRPELPGGWLRLPSSLLPTCELGFASTVHKSQGSECDEVLVLLPEAGNRLLARETLYTAVTRARTGVRIFGSEQAIREAVERKMGRYGGLREMIGQG